MPALAKPITLTDKLVKLFWNLAIPRDHSCWEWGGSISGRGYAKVAGFTASRVSFAIHYYPPPVDMEVCHTCDNPRCVRPDHLFIGTHHENMRDCVNKGRHRAGDPKPVRRSIEDQIALEMKVLELGRQGKGVREISAELKVPERLVKAYRRGATRSVGGTARFGRAA